ncbi:MAG: bifunctional metallophosphatase/5'-nucleotidase [Pirellulaceae bacterium]
MTILHTNDLHGHLTAWQGWEGDLKGKMIGGLAQLAAAIDLARKDANGDILLLDAGDLIGDTMIADLTQGQALISVFNHLKYDAMTFGNHEPDFGIAMLRERIKEAKFPFIAANLAIRSDRVSFVAPYIIKKIAGVSIGIVGLTYPKTPWTTAPKNVEELTFLDPVPAIELQLPKMQHEGAELIVVLSHLGLSGDKQLAAAVTGIDVIVGGHSHNRMEHAELVGNTLIVQAGAHGSDLGRLVLTVQDGKITSHKHTLTVLDHEVVPPDKSTETLIAKLLRPHEAALREQVGAAADWLVRAQTIAGQEARKRDAESPVDSLFADIVRETFRADIAFLPGVGYGLAIPPGPIMAAQLRQLVPHDGTLFTMRLTGTQVLDVLEQAITNVFTEDPKLKVGGMIQVSGVRFRYDPLRENGRRVANIEPSEGKWELDQLYLVVTNSMLAKGGHNQHTFSQGKELKEHGSQYEAIKLWITRNSPIRTPECGRITLEKTILAEQDSLLPMIA